MMRLPAFSLLACLLLALPPASRAAPDRFHLTSPNFVEGGFIPVRFTGEGDNVPPRLQFEDESGAKSYALIVDDPDAPSGIFTHWLIWNIPGSLPSMNSDWVTLDLQNPHAPRDPKVDVQGVNDFGVTGYSGPKPPSGTHRYFFRLFALDTTLSLPSGASRRELETAIHGHVIGTAVLMGRYAKGGSQ